MRRGSNIESPVRLMVGETHKRGTTMSCHSTRGFRPVYPIILALMLALACGDLQGPEAETPNTSGTPGEPATTPAPPADPATVSVVIVSDPAGSDGLAIEADQVGLSVRTDIVYVSLAPESIPDGKRIVIRTRATGTEVGTDLINGGFDPIAIPATVGDTLDVRLYLADRTDPEETISVVPERHPPVLVRVDPTPGRRDVPLNAVLLLVFSEPIDAATLTPTSVSLTRDGIPVAGTLAFGDAARLTVTFTPDEPLAAGADYTIFVTETIADMDGDGLEAGLSAVVTTAFDASSPIIASFARITPWSFEAEAPRLTLQENGRFGLTFANVLGVGPVTYEGDYEVTGTAYAFEYDGGSPEEPWYASATLAGDSLVVEFNLAMRQAVPPDGLVRFEDGVYLRSGSEPSPSPPLAGRIAFVHDLAGAQGRHIYVARADGTGATLLTRGLSPAWSPDGRRLALARWPDADGGGGIYLVDDDGSDLVRLVDYGGDPGWSPDGSRIVFVDTAGIRVIGIDGGGAATLLRHDFFGADPAGTQWLAEPVWSPDGQQIAFTLRTMTELSIHRIYGMDADGSRVRPLTTDSGCNRMHPAWSPDGSEVAVMACGHVALLAADGSSYRWLTPGAFPTWSPDGRWVASILGESIYVVDREGGVPQLVLSSAYVNGGGGFSWTLQE